MKQLLFIAAVVCGFILCSSKLHAADPEIPLLPVGTEAPDFTVHAWNGGDVKLSDFRGKIVVLDFWASWCPPCNKAMPGLQEVLDEYKTDIVVFAVCIRDTPSAADTWIRSHPYKFNYGFDPHGKGEAGSTRDMYHVWGIPTTYVIDRKGVIVADEVVMSEDHVVDAVRTAGAKNEDEHKQEKAEQDALREDSLVIRTGEMTMVGSVTKDFTGSGAMTISVTSLKRFNGEGHVFDVPRPKTIDITPKTFLVPAEANSGKTFHISAGTQVTVVGKDNGVGKSLTARVVQVPQPAQPASDKK